MHTNPLLDDTFRMFSHAVDEAVEFLLPSASGDARTLLIEAEAIQPGHEPFRFGLLYCRPSNYTQVYVFASGPEEVVLVGESHNWHSMKSVPRAEVCIERGVVHRGGEVLGSVKRTSYWGDGLEVVLPGRLVSYADHDSCWRDKVKEALPKEIDQFECEFRVHRVEVKGPYCGRKILPYQVADGSWTNPEPLVLTGAFALYTAMMVLAPAANRQRTLHLEAAWRLYRAETPPEKGSDEAGSYNFRRNVRDVSPRAPSFWCPLRGEAFCVFDERGRIVSFGGLDLPATRFDRDFVMSQWGLPESSDVYGLDFIGPTFNGVAFVGEKIRLDPTRLLSCPSLTFPPERLAEVD